MKKSVMLAAFIGAIFLPLMISPTANASSAVEVEDGVPVIVKVFGAPVGFESNSEGDKCKIQYGVLPMNGVTVAQGKELRIKVVGDDGINIRCNGRKGITISRD